MSSEVRPPTGGAQPPTGRAVLLDDLAIPAAMLDAAGLLVALNAAAAIRLAGTPGEAAGRPAAEVLADLDQAVRLPLLGGAGRWLIVWPDASEATVITLHRADTLGRLAGGISHDLANRFGAILTFSSVLATEPDVPADLQTSAGLLRDEADRALRLARGSLEFARRRPPSRSRVALGPLVRECLELASSAVAALDVHASVSEVMPETEADPAVLRQIVLALLLAAVEAMGGTWTPGGPTASGQLQIAGYLVEEDAHYRLRLSFDDSAPAVPARDRAGLFQGGGGRATRDLAVAAALAERCGGVLAYEAQPDGNRFVLDLPLAGESPLPRRSGRAAPEAPRPVPLAVSTQQPNPVPLPGATPPSAGAAPRPEELAPSAPARAADAATPAPVQLTVLVCDDEPSIRTLLARVISRAGHRAREASGGAEALSILDSEPVDLVMTDQRMADMSGVDLYRAATSRRPELRTRFVLMSGDASTPELVEFAAATGLQVIEKPFDLSVVSAMLRRLATA